MMLMSRISLLSTLLCLHTSNILIAFYCVLHCLCRHRSMNIRAPASRMASHVICIIVVMFICLSIMCACHSTNMLYVTCHWSSARSLAIFVASQDQCELCTILPHSRLRMPFMPLALCGHSYCTASMCTVVVALVIFYVSYSSYSKSVCTRLVRTIKPQFHCIIHLGEYRKRRGSRKTQSFVYRRSNYSVYDLGMRARYAYMLIIYAISQVNGQMMGHDALCHESENIQFPHIGEGDDMGPFMDQGNGDHLGPSEPGSPFELSLIHI